jgi:hypothetical protein
MDYRVIRRVSAIPVSLPPTVTTTQNAPMVSRVGAAAAASAGAAGPGAAPSQPILNQANVDQVVMNTEIKSRINESSRPLLPGWVLADGAAPHRAQAAASESDTVTETVAEPSSNRNCSDNKFSDNTTTTVQGQYAANTTSDTLMSAATASAHSTRAQAQVDDSNANSPNSVNFISSTREPEVDVSTSDSVVPVPPSPKTRARMLAGQIHGLRQLLQSVSNGAIDIPFVSINGSHHPIGVLDSQHRLSVQSSDSNPAVSRQHKRKAATVQSSSTQVASTSTPASVVDSSRKRRRISAPVPTAPAATVTATAQPSLSAIIPTAVQADSKFPTAPIIAPPAFLDVDVFNSVQQLRRRLAAQDTAATQYSSVAVVGGPRPGVAHHSTTASSSVNSHSHSHSHSHSPSHPMAPS